MLSKQAQEAIAAIRAATIHADPTFVIRSVSAIVANNRTRHDYVMSAAILDILADIADPAVEAEVLDAFWAIAGNIIPHDQKLLSPGKASASWVGEPLRGVPAEDLKAMSSSIHNTYDPFAERWSVGNFLRDDLARFSRTVPWSEWTKTLSAREPNRVTLRVPVEKRSVAIMPNDDDVTSDLMGWPGHDEQRDTVLWFLIDNTAEEVQHGEAILLVTLTEAEHDALRRATTPDDLPADIAWDIFEAVLDAAMEYVNVVAEDAS